MTFLEWLAQIPGTLALGFLLGHALQPATSALVAVLTGVFNRLTPKPKP